MSSTDMNMDYTGDTERQASLRDKLIKGGDEPMGGRFVSKILSTLNPHTKLLDIGCGTGHIISELAEDNKGAIFVGFDLSPAMLKIALDSAVELPNVIGVEGDGLKLPFSDGSFGVVITRLAEYSPEEAYRVLKKGGYFFEYGLGPEADKEIREFFSNRIEEENFFFPKILQNWKNEICVEIKEAGFTIEEIDDYKESDYYKNEEEIMDLIEMVPLVRNFDRDKDRKMINELAEKSKEDSGIKITWHYYILRAKRL